MLEPRCQSRSWSKQARGKEGTCRFAFKMEQGEQNASATTEATWLSRVAAAAVGSRTMRNSAVLSKNRANLPNSQWRLGWRKRKQQQWRLKISMDTNESNKPPDIILSIDRSARKGKNWATPIGCSRFTRRYIFSVRRGGGSDGDHFALRLAFFKRR